MGITSGRRIKRVLIPNGIAVGPLVEQQNGGQSEIAGEILLISDLGKYT
jgi:hypothetical protein